MLFAFLEINFRIVNRLYNFVYSGLEQHPADALIFRQEYEKALLQVIF